MRHEHLQKPEQSSKRSKPLDISSPSQIHDEHHDILNLQNQLGNEATRQLLESGQLQLKSGIIQTKLTVGAPNDQYEQEADAVAKQVMTMPDTVQRGEMEEDEMLQGKLIQRGEMEEDEMLQGKLIQREEMEEDEMLQGKLIQREEMEEDEEMLQTKSESSVPQVTDDIENKINSMRGAGQSIPDGTRDFLEPRFEQDFSNVNIHTGGESDALNQQLQAKAFTLGNDIFFRDGEYNPDSSGGRELLSHELTHVVQQGGSTQRKETDENTES